MQKDSNKNKQKDREDRFQKLVRYRQEKEGKYKIEGEKVQVNEGEIRTSQQKRIMKETQMIRFRNGNEQLREWKILLLKSNKY